MDWFLDSSHALSLVAIIVSLVAWITSWKTQKRLVVIEEAREHDRLKHASKAKLRGELVREPGSRRMRDLLRIYNDGEVEARDVTTKLDGLPLIEHPALLSGTIEIRQIGPHSYAQYVLGIASGKTPPWNLEVSWTDDSGEPGKYRTTLTF